VGNRNSLLITEEYLKWSAVRSEGGANQAIIVDTRVFPASTIEPGDCVLTVEAGPRGRKERPE